MLPTHAAEGGSFQMTNFQKGALILVDFEEGDTENKKTTRRPAVIVLDNAQRGDYWVVPVTSASEPKSSGVMIPVDTVGLKIDGWIDCNVIATVSKKMILNKIGQLSDETVAEVTECLCQKIRN